MQSLFEPKTELAWDRDIWNRMNSMATDLLRDKEKHEYTQAIVLFSSAGKEYGTVIQDALSQDKTEEEALFDRLRGQNDTEIRYVLCMWQDGAIDIPSISLRRMLCTLNSNNTESKVFVMTRSGIAVILLGITVQ